MSKENDEFIDNVTLCIDIGGHSVRSILYDSHCNSLASFSETIDTQRPQKNRVEHSAGQLLESLTMTLHRAIDFSHGHGLKIKCAGLATQRSSIVAWDETTGQALSPVLSWQDTRGRKWLERLKIESNYIKQVTGLVLSPHYGANKIRWCLHNLENVKTALKQNRLKVGPLASFIIASITELDAVVVDVGNASRTLLWNYRKNTWDKTLLQMFNIEQSILPVVVDTRYNFGQLRLDKTIPLKLVVGDQPAAIYAIGQVARNRLYINMGSGAFILRLSEDKDPESPLLTSVLLRDKEQVILAREGTVNGVANALSWLQASTGGKKPIFYKALVDTVSSPGYFLNGVGGLASPWWDAGFESRFVDCDSFEEKTLAVYESILFMLLENYYAMQIKSLPEAIVLSGGLSVDARFNQSLANLFGLTTYGFADVEATARGVARLLSQSSPGQLLSGESVFEQAVCFSPRKDRLLESRFQNWREQMLKQIRESHDT